MKTRLPLRSRSRMESLDIWKAEISRISGLNNATLSNMNFILSRRGFLASGAALCAAPALRAAGNPCLILSTGVAQRIRDAVARDSARAAILRKNADAALKAGPWSVTFHRPDYVKADLHEYYSEG